MVAAGGMRMMSGLFVVTGGMVLGRLLVVGGGVGVVLGGFGVVFSGLFAHGISEVQVCFWVRCSFVNAAAWVYRLDLSPEQKFWVV